MAKGNMLLGKARGSVGDLTFSVLNSEQITRAKAKSVKNPRTDAQMIQRVLMSTTVHAYSGMQEIVDHSFQGVPYQGRSMNRFNQLNVKNLRALYAQIAGGSTDVPVVFNANGNKRVSLAPWIMSTGSLPTVGLKIDTVASEAWPVAILDRFDVGGSFVDTGVAIDASFESAPSYADLIAYFGLQAGDQLTLCAHTRLVSDNEAGCNFKYGRFILQPNDGDLSHLLTDATVANEKNQGISFRFEDGSLFMNFADLVEAEENNRTFIMEAAIITSRLENNAWKRSNSQMVMCTDDLADGGVDMESAIDSYSSVQFDTNSPWYLNKAGRGTTAEPAGVLQPGEVGFVSVEGNKVLSYNDNGTAKPVAYAQGSSNRRMLIVDARAFGKTLSEAYNAGYVVDQDESVIQNYVSYATLTDKVVKNATMGI